MRKVKETETKTKKILSVFLSVLVLTITINLSFFYSTAPVEAQEQWVCCVKADGECNDDMLRSECIAEGGRPYTGACSRVPECSLGTCIPKIAKLPINEVLPSHCQYNKHKSECEAEKAAWSPDIPAMCEQGCCKIPSTVIGRVCTTLPKYVCEELSRRDGGEYEFEAGIVGEACYLSCAPDKEGCCVVGGGECKYQTREECSGTFYEGRYCSEIGSPHCIVEAHAMKACCNPLNLEEREIDRAICWFDSAGNQEEIVRNCPYPEAKCEVCMDEECADINQSMIIDFGQPYCKDRSCYLEEGALGSVKLNSITRDQVKFEKVDAPKKLLHGESTCYDFLTGHNLHGLDLNDKSTGLQSQILRCFESEIEINQLGVDRETLCLQITPVHAETIENNWEECRTCADKAGFWNTIQDASLALPKGGFRLLFLLQITGPYCKEDECEKLGETRVEGMKKQMCWYNYDTSWPNNGAGLGSCDPVYPPGKTEMCESCGAGGDWLYNVCDEAECYSLGNCQFESLNTWDVITHFLSRFLPAFFVTRMSVVPTLDCGVEAIMCGPAYPTCYAHCIVDRTKYVNPICWASALVGSAVKKDAAQKWLSAIAILGGIGLPLPSWMKYVLIGGGMLGSFIKGEEPKKEQAKNSS